MTDAGDLERVEKLFQETLALEKQFKSLLERQTPYAVDVTNLLQTYPLPPNEPLICDSIRQQTENVLFGDIEYALSKTVEERLWTHVHYRVIDDYRKRIANVCLIYCVLTDP
jgi:hypothetical protein